jgi:hypothetical protein
LRQDPVGVAKTHIDTAEKITAEQVERAKVLYRTHFVNSDNPQAMAAIIQSLATNYLAVVINNHR